MSTPTPARVRELAGVAEAVPEAAGEALRSVWPREDVAAALLATDGAASGIDTYRVLDE